MVELSRSNDAFWSRRQSGLPNEHREVYTYPYLGSSRVKEEPVDEYNMRNHAGRRQKQLRHAHRQHRPRKDVVQRKTGLALDRENGIAVGSSEGEVSIVVTEQNQIASSMDKNRDGGGRGGRGKAEGSLTPEAVALHVLRRIMSGEFAPGSQLPAQAVLRPQISRGLSMTVFSRGIRLLKERGFLDVAPHRHTRVAELLPHRRRVALILPAPREGRADTSLFSVFERVVRAYGQGPGGLDLEIFYQEERYHEDGASLVLLKERVRWHEFGGILFTCQLWDAGELYTEPGVARVFNGENLRFRQPWMDTAPRYISKEPLQGDFLFRALERVAAWGKKNVAVLHLGGIASQLETSNREREEWQPLVEGLPRFGLTTRPEWLLEVVGSGWEIGRLLMATPERPEAVLIQDDSLIPAVTAGMASMPGPWPALIGLVNFPVLPRSHLPITFAGHDIGALVTWCFKALRDPELQRAKPAYEMEVLFEDEWRGRGGEVLVRQ